MTDFQKHIAEVEGVRTPTHVRSQAEIDAAYKDHVETRSAKTKTTAKSEKAKRESKPKTTKAKVAKGSKAKTESVTTETVTQKPTEPTVTIDRQPITVNAGQTSSAGYDPKSKTMHVEFSKGNVYAYPETPEADWKGFEATFADAESISGNYFRKNFRGRKYARVITPVAAKAAPVKGEVKK